MEKGIANGSIACLPALTDLTPKNDETFPSNESIPELH
jgi:hypothetical protein